MNNKLRPNFSKIAPLSAELVDGMNVLSRTAYLLARDTITSEDTIDQVMNSYDQLEAHLIKEYPEHAARILMVGIASYMRGANP